MRWYLRYSLSYRDLEEMMRECGLRVDHTTMYRWVQHYAPELERRCRPHLKPTTDLWRVDETSIKVKKEWMYLYRAVDSHGQTLDFFAHIDERRKSSKALLAQNPCRFPYQRTTGHHCGQKRSVPKSIRGIESGRRSP